MASFAQRSHVREILVREEGGRRVKDIEEEEEKGRFGVQGSFIIVSFFLGHRHGYGRRVFSSEETFRMDTVFRFVWEKDEGKICTL